MKTVYSIIVPTHNSSGFIINLLNTIPNRNDLEVIIIDDHSTDYGKLKKIVSEHALAGQINVSQSPGFKSAGTARNAGLKRAKGTFVIFADSDDHFTNKAQHILTEYQDNDADLIICKSEGNHITNRVHNLNSLLAMEDPRQIRFRHIVPWSKIIRKQLIDEHRLSFSETPVSNDELFSAKVGFYAKKMLIEKTSLYSSYERDGSLTMQTHDTSLQDIRLYEVYKKYTFLQKSLGNQKLQDINLSILSNIKGAVSVGGIIYGLRWYLKIRKAGGRLNIISILARKAKG